MAFSRRHVSQYWLTALLSWGCALTVTGFQTSCTFHAKSNRPASTCSLAGTALLRGDIVRERRQNAVMGLRAQFAMPTLECVKNTRDLASVTGSPVKAGRAFRTSCVGTASENDSCIIIENIKTLIDLRSDREYQMDAEKYNSTVWASYDEMIYSVKKSKSGRATALIPTRAEGSIPRARHMLSVIDESIYKRGVFKRMHPGKKIKAAAYFAVSYTRAKQYFIDYINRAGLPLLNELILDYGGPSIKACLDVLADRSNHPVAFYCTAGKDRTGLIAMLVLSVLGVDDEAIVSDYVLSDSVYSDMKDKSAMVGALQQENLDPDTFLRAPRSVMDSTMKLLRKEYGGPHKYLESIGFGPADVLRLRAALCDE
eukprot:CAMPEP_0179441318 /NCGR_PEP_ID=MMETSP0799-20121207/24890_1 /TAXON_ID=46947 /ORGANISM="Geminigera cryophila, Strain CCMP2564" /LENGTH=369 /DNA_ID=CAMNT_0021225493 /DNA_START=3 /DNA_END=1112 /DNA_ORIENTATION=-